MLRRIDKAICWYIDGLARLGDWETRIFMLPFKGIWSIIRKATRR